MLRSSVSLQTTAHCSYESAYWRICILVMYFVDYGAMYRSNAVHRLSSECLCRSGRSKAHVYAEAPVDAINCCSIPNTVYLCLGSLDF